MPGIDETLDQTWQRWHPRTSLPRPDRRPWCHPRSGPGIDKGQWISASVASEGLSELPRVPRAVPRAPLLPRRARRVGTRFCDLSPRVRRPPPHLAGLRSA